MSKTNKIDSIMSGTLKTLNNLIDVNTVVGESIETKDGIIVPVTKVTYAYLTGGGEYGDVKFAKKNENLPFSGGSGAVVNIKPIGFLFQNKEGIRVLPVETDLTGKIMDVLQSVAEKFGEKN